MKLNNKLAKARFATILMSQASGLPERINARRLIVYTIALIALMQGAYGIHFTASGGGNGEGGSASMDFDTLETTSVSSQMAVNGATLTPSTVIAGPIAKFEQTHSVKDKSGKSASVYVNVVNAPNGLIYSSNVQPKEGSVDTQNQVSAEQTLTVPKANSIKCTATSSYGTTRSASVGLEESKNPSITGDYVTLLEYCGSAIATGTSVLASQTATSGAANSIKIYGTAKDSSGTYKVDTPLKGISGGKATIKGLSETSSAGTTTQVAQKEHVLGTFTSKASYTPTTGTAKTKTRTSNYGTDYDLDMQSTKGSLPTGILGYYANPSMATASRGAIQGAVNIAQSGDTVNAAAGTYTENVLLNKPLTLTGTGLEDDQASNTIIQAKQKDQPVIAITSGDTTVKNLQVKGANELSSGSAGSGIKIAGSEDISHVTLENVASKGNYFGLEILADGIDISDVNANGIRFSGSVKADSHIAATNGGSVSASSLNGAQISAQSTPSDDSTPGSGLSVDQKLRAERLTSLFENGVIELQYGYAENLHDGRGITCGFEGFCTGTGDAYLVVKQYTDLNPNNPLAKYLPELTRLLTASNPGSTTKLSGFITDWATAANDPVFRQVQENVGDSLYYTPAMNYASEWGMTTSLSKAFIWDTMVMHGDGDLEELDSTPAIFDRTFKQMGGSPATGVDEKEFLVAFIAMRKADLLYSYDPESRDVWREAAQRCDVFTEIVNAGNWDLNGPIAITNREYGPITIP